MADALRAYYLALVPPRDQPEIGPEGLPVISRYLHLRDVTIMSAGHSIKLPLWRGKLSEVDAFVMGATASEQPCSAWKHVESGYPSVKSAEEGRPYRRVSIKQSD